MFDIVWAAPVCPLADQGLRFDQTEQADALDVIFFSECREGEIGHKLS